MWGARFLFVIVAALAVGACMRTPAQTGYISDPQTYRQPQAASTNARALYSSSPAYAQQSYAQETSQQPVTQARTATGGGRGLFTSQGAAQTDGQRPYIAQYAPPSNDVGGPYVAAPYGYAAAPAVSQPAYTLDSGDKLRVMVFGQDGISNSYTVDVGGNINLPLVGSVAARGHTTQQLSRRIAERLKQGYVREPHVSVEVEAYRPFFILGEVTNPGQYPYVANMTAETAVAIAGGFAPRASKDKVELTRNAPGQQIRGEVPLGYLLRPGDTVVVKERWF
jgi:polysaccharide export outer membrane protein